MFARSHPYSADHLLTIPTLRIVGAESNVLGGGNFPFHRILLRLGIGMLRFCDIVIVRVIEVAIRDTELPRESNFVSTGRNCAL